MRKEEFYVLNSLYNGSIGRAGCTYDVEETKALNDTEADGGALAHLALGLDLAAVCLDDGGTDRKPDAHAVLAAVGRGIGGQHTGEQGAQALLRNAAAVVRYLKHRPAAQREHPQGQLGHPLGVDGGIFQKVRQHLRDQH